MPAEVAMGATKSWLPPKTGPQDLHSGPLHFAFGATVTAVMGVLRLRLQWWPFYPVGFLLVYTWGLKVIWFSIFVGWLIKATVLRLGGPRLLRGATPIFMGMILGEAGAAAFWLVVTLVRPVDGPGLPRGAVAAGVISKPGRNAAQVRLR